MGIKVTHKDGSVSNPKYGYEVRMMRLTTGNPDVHFYWAANNTYDITEDEQFITIIDRFNPEHVHMTRIPLINVAAIIEHDLQ